MVTEIWLCPFKRSIVGGRGSVLLRSNHEHAEAAAAAIRRRTHPAWSRLRCGFEVTDAETRT